MRPTAAIALSLLALLAGCPRDEAPRENSVSASSHGARRSPSSTARIYTGANVLTMDEARPRATGLRVDGDRITHLWSGATPRGLTGQVIDLRGATVLPGLVDAHLHLRGIGQAEREIDLRGTRSVDEIAQRVRDAAGRTPPGTWIRGRGWDQNDWADSRFPAHGVLDRAAPDHPVWLTRVDGHAAWVSASALRLASITRATESPSGGEVLRDARGEPTGIFIDNAMALVEGELPAPSASEIRADLERALVLCRRAGLTGVHDMGVSAATVAVLRDLEREGRLTLRVTAYLDGSDDAAVGAARPDPPSARSLVRVVGVKLFADGALGSRGAALLAPYSDRRSTSGLLVTEPDALAERALALHRAGWQIAIHAIGDRGNRIALDALDRAQLSDRSRRHRIEHAQVLSPEDIPRFASLGVVASMQPTHATSDMPWAEARVGAERIRGAYAWRTLLDAHAKLAFGSDAPVEELSPWLGIYAAVTRQDLEGKPEGGWRGAERLTVTEAIAGFTRGAAYAAHDEARLGVIREGALADITVVARDPEHVAPLELASMPAVRTIVAGREVFIAHE